MSKELVERLRARSDKHYRVTTMPTLYSNSDADLDDSVADALEASLAREERLREYAWHHDDCDACREGGELRHPLVKCSCGYDAALGESK